LSITFENKHGNGVGGALLRPAHHLHHEVPVGTPRLPASEIILTSRVSTSKLYGITDPDPDPLLYKSACLYKYAKIVKHL
jgi:hypothetical protein